MTRSGRRCSRYCAASSRRCGVSAVVRKPAAVAHPVLQPMLRAPHQQRAHAGCELRTTASRDIRSPSPTPRRADSRRCAAARRWRPSCCDRTRPGRGPRASSSAPRARTVARSRIGQADNCVGSPCASDWLHGPEAYSGTFARANRSCSLSSVSIRCLNALGSSCSRACNVRMKRPTGRPRSCCNVM